MSWDVLVYRLGAVRPTDPVAAGLTTPEGPGAPVLDLGSPEEVRIAIDRCFPRTSWEQPTGGMMMLGDMSVSFYYARTARPHLTIQVHGPGDARPSLGRLCFENGWTAVEAATGTYFDPLPYRPTGMTTRLAGATGRLSWPGTAALSGEQPTPSTAPAASTGRRRELIAGAIGLVAYLLCVGVLYSLGLMGLVPTLIVSLAVAAVSSVAASQLLDANKKGA